MFVSWSSYCRKFARLSGVGVLVLTLCSGVATAASEERWLKVAAPEFTVITPLREKEAVAWTAEFSQFVAALQSFINLNPKRLPRLTIVVLTRERDFARFQPRHEDGTPMEVAGFFSRRASWAVAGVVG